MKSSKLSMRTRHFLEGYSFVALWVVGFIAFMAVPLGRSLIFSFQELKTSKDGLLATYVGWQHYRAAFAIDVNFRPYLIETLTTMLHQVPLILIFSIFCALLLNREIIGKTFFRGVFFLPVIIASGLVLKKLMADGAANIPIFANEDLARQLMSFFPRDIVEPLLNFAESLSMVMWDSGVQILIFLAGLQTISISLYEAAKCDGATKWEMFWKITFPMLMPMIFVNTLYSIVNSFTKPDNLMMDHILNVVFKNNNFGFGSAMGWIYFVFIFLVLAIVFYIFRNALSTTEGRR